jgi:hypothetical protein
MASTGLIPFDEASRRPRISGQAYIGIQEIPVDRIVGSVDCSDDFGRDFRPRRRLSRSRLARVAAGVLRLAREPAVAALSRRLTRARRTR